MTEKFVFFSIKIFLLNVFTCILEILSALPLKKAFLKGQEINH